MADGIRLVARSAGRLAASGRLLRSALPREPDESDETYFNREGGVFLAYGSVAPRLGDPARYEKFREAVLDHGLRARNVIHAERDCRLTLITPADEQFLSRLKPVQEMVLSGINDPETLRMDITRKYRRAMPAGEALFRDFAFLALAIYEYRCGDYVQAIRWCDQFPKSPVTGYAIVGAATAVHSIAAMSHFRLGQIAKAQTALAIAQIVNQSADVGYFFVPQKFGFGTFDEDGLFDRLYGSHLLREAEVLLNGSVTEDHHPDAFVAHLNALFNRLDPAYCASSFAKASEHGYTPAQLYLGYSYANGNGVEKNEAEALNWFLKSTSQVSWTCFCSENVAGDLVRCLGDAERIIVERPQNARNLTTIGALHYLRRPV